MAVLPHEGRFPILFRAYAVPTGSGAGAGYLARPDKTGVFPLVVVLPGMAGLGSQHKDLCRRLARHGYVAFALDPYRGNGPGASASLDDALRAYEQLTDRQALTDMTDSLQHFSSLDWVAPDPVGLVGLGVGGRLALLYASGRPEVGAVAVIASPLGGDGLRDRQVGSELGRVTASVLGLYGLEDQLVPADQVDEAKALNPTGQWLLYPGARHGFFDQDRAEFDAEAAEDAFRRVVSLLTSTLRMPAPADY